MDGRGFRRASVPGVDREGGRELSRRAFARGALAIGVSALGAACEARARPPLAAAATPEQDAAEIARGIVGGRTGALFYVDRMRGRPGADRIVEFGHWGELSRRMGMDPMQDVHRAFACGATSGAVDSVLLLEHALSDEDARAALARSATQPGAGSLPFPNATLGLESVVATVALPRSGLLALAPSWAAASLTELVASGSLPNPRGTEIARFFAFHPGESLGSNPEWPPTISAAQAEIGFDESGGANVLFQATSTTPEQAALDAATMTKTLDDLLHIQLGPLRIPIFDPIAFHADGDVVRMEAHLLATDVDWILGFGR